MPGLRRIRDGGTAVSVGPQLKRLRISRDVDSSRGASLEPFNEHHQKPLRIANSQIDDVSAAFTQSMTQKMRKRHGSFMTQHREQEDTSDTDTDDDDGVDDGPADSGIILRLELYNFMCHKAFSLDFGGQTNFIIGRNGSGKSAILTGLSVALGARASDTDRGNSLKGLIMHGKNVARVKVVFKNEGSEAFQPDVYGDRILIERTIRSVGTSGFIIRNASGRTVSTRRQTITEMLDWFGITIANPMTILTQTDAKTFLARSDDTRKFRFFMQGTRLQESFDNVLNLKKNVKEIKQTIMNSGEILKQAKSRYRDASEIWSNFRNSDEFKRRQEILTGKRLWLEVTKKESQMERAKKVLKDRETLQAGVEAQMKQFQTEVEEMKEKRQKQKAAGLDQLLQKIQDCEMDRDTNKEEIGRLQGEKRSQDVNIRNINQEIEEDKTEIIKFEAQIKEEKIRIQNSTGDAYARIENLKKVQTERLKDVERQKETATSKMHNAQQDLHEMQVGDRADLADLQREVKRLQIEKTRIRGAGTQEKLLGPNFCQLLGEINRSRRSFRAPIVGPIGTHVQLKESMQRWRWVLETILQRTLSSFLVQNFGDSRTLQQMMRNSHIHNDITVRKPEVFDYRHSIPHTGQQSILDALQVDKKEIECYLVDTNRIQSTLLIDDRRKAEEILMKDDRNAITAALCFVPGGALRITKKHGSLQIDPIQPNRRQRPFPLQVVGHTLDPTKQIETEIKKADSKLRTLQAEINQKQERLKQECRDLQKELVHARQEAGAIRAAITKASNKLVDMEGGTAKLSALETSKSEKEDQVTINLQQMRGLKQESDDTTMKLKKQRDKFAHILKEYQGLLREKNSVASKVEQLDAKISEFEDNIKVDLRKKDKYGDDIERLHKFVDDEMPDVLSMLSKQADKQCSREDADLQPSDTIQSVQKEIYSITESLKKIEQEVGIPRAEAAENVRSTRSRYIKMRGELDDAVKLHNRLCSALETRLDNLTSTASLLIQEVNSAFESAMRLRHFRGKIDFDFAHAKLHLRVATKPTEELRNVDSFSGGEKSYAQIAFLLSIWKPMQSRVRGLDEFDVFMDQINRRLALKLILQKVSENPKTQTIFITPLSIGNVQGLDDKSVHIHEITPPERNANRS